MTETDSIFNEVAQEIVSSNIVTAEKKERDNMDYLFWFVCSDISAGRVIRFLKLCPGCSHSQPFESFELKEKLPLKHRKAGVRFIGLDFTYYSIRLLRSFYEMISVMCSGDYVELQGAERFIICANGDKDWILQCGNLFTDLCRLVLNKTMAQVDEKLREIKEQNAKYCSDSIFDEIIRCYPYAYDVSIDTSELYIFLKDEYATKFNIFSNNFETVMNLGTKKINGQYKIYKCASQILSDGSFELAMILYRYYDDSERILFCRHFKDVEEFLNMTIFKADVRNILQDKLDIVSHYNRVFNGVYVRN